MHLNPHTKEAIIGEMKQDYRRLAVAFEKQLIANMGKRSPDVKEQVREFVTRELRQGQEKAKRVIQHEGNEPQRYVIEWFEHACHNADTPDQLQGRLDIWKSYQRTCLLAEEDTLRDIMTDLTMALGLQ